MGPKPRTPENNDLFRQRLDELVNLSHPLVQLAQHIDWSVFEDGWGGFFPSHRGRPATRPRLVAGLLYLQHTFALSDEAVVWGWVENPYWQLFCGETWFQHQPPIDPSSLTRWRQRIQSMPALPFNELQGTSIKCRYCGLIPPCSVWPWFWLL